MFRASPSLTLLIAALAIVTPARADDLAFITAQSPINALLVYDVATMTQVSQITGFGVEPGRMVANADRSRLYVVSRVPPTLTQSDDIRVNIVSPAQRRILRSAVVSDPFRNAIAISPDGARLYVLKRINATEVLGVSVLDASTLAEVGFVPLPWAPCVNVIRDVLVAPDGRIVAGPCIDGLRVIDPGTLAATVLPLESGLLDLIGFAPTGTEVYVRRLGTSATAGNALLAAIDLGTGVHSNIVFALPPTSPNPGGVPARLVRVRRPADPASDPTVFITYGPTAGGSPPIVSTPSSELTPPNRRLTRLTSLGTPSASFLGVSEDGRVGVLGNTRLLRRVNLDPVPSGEPIAAEGATVEIAPSGNTPLVLTDIILTRPMLESGFE